MKEGSFLLIVFRENPSGEEVECLYAMTHERWIELRELKDLLFKESLSSFSHENFPHVKSLEELHKVAFYFCEALEKEKVYLLAASSLNSLLEHDESLTQIKEHLFSSAILIQNVELMEKKKTLFSRLLGD